MRGEVHITRMEAGPLAVRVAQDAGLQIVDEDDAAGAAEKLKGVAVALQEVFHRFAAGKFHIRHAAVAEHHDEKGKPPPRRAQLDHTGAAPVHLGGFAGPYMIGYLADLTGGYTAGLMYLVTCGLLGSVLVL